MGSLAVVIEVELAIDASRLQMSRLGRASQQEHEIADWLPDHTTTKYMIAAFRVRGTSSF
jgi:hypothetical protein